MIFQHSARWPNPSSIQWIRPHSHSGGGATGGGTDRSDPGYNPWKKETWNLTEQSKIFRTDPERARNLARQAGETLPPVAV
jgi:hypothetical protein